MKTFVIENNTIAFPEKPTVWTFLPDSALCNAGKPFFIPEFADYVEAHLSAVMKISRLGKSIQPRFAHRYYSELAPAIHFRIPQLRERLMAQGFPPDMGQAFDRSLIIGEFVPAAELSINGKTILLKNGTPEATWDDDNFRRSGDEILSDVSATNTMKMGDYILPALTKGVRIDIGDILEIKTGEKSLLSVQIK